MMAGPITDRHHRTITTELLLHHRNTITKHRLRHTATTHHRTITITMELLHRCVAKCRALPDEASKSFSAD
ncbi:MAG: hypothetical protein IJU76_04320 [Desulfovibrionaceae bacterium]|nr:hypothetical protein [Desulfovibrionaceae bacterium]